MNTKRVSKHLPPGHRLNSSGHALDSTRALFQVGYSFLSRFYYVSFSRHFTLDRRRNRPIAVQYVETKIVRERHTSDPQRAVVASNTIVTSAECIAGDERQNVRAHTFKKPQRRIRIRHFHWSI